MRQHIALITLKVSADSTGALQGKLIKLAREASDLTQAGLGEKIGVSRATISKWESEGVGDEIYRLEEILGVEHGAFKVNDSV